MLITFPNAICVWNTPLIFGENLTLFHKQNEFRVSIPFLGATLAFFYLSWFALTESCEDDECRQIKLLEMVNQVKKKF